MLPGPERSSLKEEYDGMIVYGYKTANTVLGRTQQVCPACHRAAAQTVVRTRTWVTIFWVKVFPISKKSIMRCSACGAQTKIDNAQADAWFQHVPVGAPQQPMGR